MPNPVASVETPDAEARIVIMSCCGVQAYQHGYGPPQLFWQGMPMAAFPQMPPQQADPRGMSRQQQVCHTIHSSTLRSTLKPSTTGPVHATIWQTQGNDEHLEIVFEQRIDETGLLAPRTERCTM